jgi:GNAT superfamily N-acetyltransferase
MDVVVTTTPDGWAARHGQATVGTAAALVRPDNRCFVFLRSCRTDTYRPLVQAIAQQLQRDLYTEVGEADTEVLQRLVGLGFVVNRQEHIYAIATDSAIAGLTDLAVPAGFEILTADRVSEDRLRALDDDLRQDVPGTDGWRWDRPGFRKETYDAPDFDPTTYLVAVEQATGRDAGLVRVWMRPSGPRLGLIAVGRGYRRRGLATVLLARVFGVLQQAGKTDVVAEVDITNTAANRLLTHLGARRTGGTIELLRPWPVTSPA